MNTSTSSTIRTAISAALLALAVPALGQTTTTNRVEWDYTAPLSEVTSYVHTVSIDAVAVTQAVSCAPRVGVAGDVTCGVTVPVLAAGSHTVTIAATFAGQTSSTTVSGLDPSKGPKQPNGNPRVMRVITITIP